MKNDTKIIVILALLLAGLLVFAAFTMLNPAPDYKYIVTNEGGTYYAKDTKGGVLSSSTDASAAINNALNSLSAGRTSKEKVQLQGEFTIDAPIVVPSYAILDATGAKLTWGTDSRDHMLTASKNNNFEIVGGEWSGNGTARPFEFQYCTNAIIKGPSSSQKLMIHDGFYDNLVFDHSDYITISNVEVYNAGHTGILMSVCSNCVVENCYIHDCLEGGGCYFYSEDDGIAQTVSNNVLRNNLVERTNLSGLSLASLRGEEDVGTNSVAESNTCIDCGLDGSHPGIACGWGDNKATNCIIRNNSIYETKTYWPPTGNGSEAGLGLACNDSQVYGNVVHDIHDGGIYLLGDRNVVTNNQVFSIQETGYGGILVMNATSNEITNNTIGNCPVGIRLSGCSSDRLADNKFQNMSEYIIVIPDADSTGNIIENNVCQGTAEIYDNGTGTIIRNNSVI